MEKMSKQYKLINTNTSLNKENYNKKKIISDKIL